MRYLISAALAIALARPVQGKVKIEASAPAPSPGGTGWDSYLTTRLLQISDLRATPRERAFPGEGLFRCEFALQLPDSLALGPGNYNEISG